VTPPDAIHRVGAVQLSVRIDEDRPWGMGLGDILPSRLLALKRDHQWMHIEPIQRGLRVPQLQHVSTTGQSKQMPMQHQEKPLAPVVLKSVCPTVGVEQLEWCRGTADHARHRHKVTTSPATTGAWDAAWVSVSWVSVSCGVVTVRRPAPP
jgi:hypothetical protein